MRFVWWLKGRREDASRLHEEERGDFARVQRELAKQWEGREAQVQKRLTTMVERIRGWRGSVPEATLLGAEQRQMRGLLERLDVADTDTVELLREWRDWMRAFREGRGQDAERVELVGSELRLRGVIDKEERPEQSFEEMPKTLDDKEKLDVFSEWDQYLGERLSATGAFWERRVAEVAADGVHPRVVHGFVKQMKQAQGQANTWRRMQRG